MLTRSCRRLRALLRFLGCVTTFRTRSPPLVPGRPRTPGRAAARRHTRPVASGAAAASVATLPRPSRPAAPASTATLPARARHVRRSRPRARRRTPDAAMITGCGAERPRRGRLTPQPVIMRTTTGRGREPNRVARTGSAPAAPPGSPADPSPAPARATYGAHPDSPVPAGAEPVKTMSTSAGSHGRIPVPPTPAARLPRTAPTPLPRPSQCRHARTPRRSRRDRGDESPGTRMIRRPRRRITQGQIVERESVR